jgi:hypothetical protein
MFLAGAALGRRAAQRGNGTMSAGGPTQRSEAGGGQGVLQNHGASRGTALIGSVMIASLSSVFAGAVAESTLPAEVKSAVQVRTEHGITPVAVADVPKIATDAGVSGDDATTLAGLYETSQLRSLELSFGALALVSCGALFLSRNLPRDVVGGSAEPVPSRPQRRSARRA